MQHTNLKRNLKSALFLLQMHVLVNAEPKENVAVRNQFSRDRDDIEIHRARRVIHQPTRFSQSTCLHSKPYPTSSMQIVFHSGVQDHGVHMHGT
jgi:hypothetical protein